MTKKFSCSARIKVVPHGQGMYFVTEIPKDVSLAVRRTYGVSPRGFGAVPVTITVGNTTWTTSIFPDRRSQTYLLLLNKKVRQQEQIIESDIIKIAIKLH